MIIVRLDGGLGNQLFQYATGRALAMRHGTELVLDTTALGSHGRGRTARQLELQRFRCLARAATTAELRGLSLLRRLPRLARLLTGRHVHVERGLGHDPGVASLPDGSYLSGYWQSFKYFEDIAPTLLADLRPAQPLSPASQALADGMAGTATVAVHVRRGDYVSLAAAAQLHGSLPITYYEAAIDRVRHAVAAPRFYLFSDDPAWCRANLPLDAAETVAVTHNQGENAWQDLVLMSRCQHHIIANSSFSWWSAWLADQRGPVAQRQVMAPARWFAGQAHDTRDRFPAHWQALAS